MSITQSQKRGGISRVTALLMAAAAVSLPSLTSSRLVVYGPSALKDKFEYSGKHQTITNLY